MFDIDDNRAPGPDRYTSSFYKKAWSIVGKDVCLGNGEKINIWHDLWSCKGVLSEVVTSSCIHNTRFKDEMTVSEMIEDNKWKWAAEWLVKYPILKDIEVPILNSQKEDVTMWKSWKYSGFLCKGSTCVYNFSAKEALVSISQQNEVVKWDKVVWFSQCNPRMAFILWMAVKGRLQTQDRVMRWNNDARMKCPLCDVINDSHRHLFFECDFTKWVWGKLKEKMETAWMSNSWEDVVEQYVNSPCNNTIDSILRRIGLSSAVYHIWKERNARLFAGDKTNKQGLLKSIIENIKLQLLCLKVRKTAQVLKVAKRWDVMMNYSKNK